MGDVGGSSPPRCNMGPSGFSEKKHNETYEAHGDCKFVVFWFHCKLSWLFSQTNMEKNPGSSFGKELCFPQPFGYRMFCLSLVPAKVTDRKVA